jgi:hypothetical protein
MLWQLFNLIGTFLLHKGTPFQAFHSWIVSVKKNKTVNNNGTKKVMKRR